MQNCFKVICIINFEKKNYLTVGKVYEVISTTSGCYRLIDDRKNNKYYSTIRFKKYNDVTKLRKLIGNNYE